MHPVGRLLWRALALTALGLWASLVPQVTYPSATSGKPSNHVLTAWPGWGVQQDLGQLDGVVGHFDIWMASEPGADSRLTVIASLLDAENRGVLRQTTSHVTPSHIPVVRTLRFPSYVVPEGQRLVLQLQVPDDYEYSVSYRLARPQAAYGNVMLNGMANAGGGPLAFAHQVTNSGLRAALNGKPDARIRLVLALLLSGLAVLTHPRVAGGVRRADPVKKRLARRVSGVWLRFVGPNGEPDTIGPPTGLRRVFAAPWYPWLAAVIPILHFLASNPLHFAVAEAVIPVSGVLLVVTVAMICLRLVLQGWHQAAAAATAFTVIFFAYGHVERVLDGRLDDYQLFPAAIVLAAAAVMIAVRVRDPIARWTPFLNVSAGVLLLFQTLTLVGTASGESSRPSHSEPATVNTVTSHLFSEFPQIAGRDLPDIYYIILDAYGRDDALGEFDNTAFVKELERRGFFVAREATSNYKSSIQSLASSLNLAYLDDLGPRAPKTKRDGIALVQNNALATILKNLGYTYVHLESGQLVSSEAPLADIVVTFAPAGVSVSSSAQEKLPYRYIQPAHSEGLLQSAFLRTLAQTTALHPLADHWFRPPDTSPYQWWAPERTLQMFGYLTESADLPGPKFVFAHIIKPHKPATFDQHGNMFLSKEGSVGFSDVHDPTVPDAYIGQLIFINSLVLRTVDSILENYEDKPIIVIAGDHGRSNGYPRHAILAAFHLPDGGGNALPVY